MNNFLAESTDLVMVTARTIFIIANVAIVIACAITAKLLIDKIKLDQARANLQEETARIVANDRKHPVVASRPKATRKQLTAQIKAENARVETMKTIVVLLEHKFSYAKASLGKTALGLFGFGVIAHSSQFFLQWSSTI